MLSPAIIIYHELVSESEIERIKEEKNQEIGRMQERMMNTMTEKSVDEQELREKILELNELIQSRDKQVGVIRVDGKITQILSPTCC